MGKQFDQKIIIVFSAFCFGIVIPFLLVLMTSTPRDPVVVEREDQYAPTSSTTETDRVRIGDVEALVDEHAVELLASYDYTVDVNGQEIVEVWPEDIFSGVLATELAEVLSGKDCTEFLGVTNHQNTSTRCETFSGASELVVGTYISRTESESGPNITSGLIVYTPTVVTHYWVRSPEVEAAVLQMKSEIFEEHPEFEPYAEHYNSDQYAQFVEIFRDRIDTYIQGNGYSQEVYELQRRLTSAAKTIVEAYDKERVLDRQSFGGFTWIGRLVEDPVSEYDVYELLRIDADGNKTVVFTRPRSEDSVEWDYYEGSQGYNARMLVFTYIASPGEAFRDFTTVYFNWDGEETMRIQHHHPSGGMTFQKPGLPWQAVGLVTSESCAGKSGYRHGEPWLTPETQLLGIQVRSEDGSSQMFDLPELQTVPCGVSYGDTVTDPFIYDIDLSPTGATFELPTGGHAWVVVDESTGEVRVGLY